MRTPVLRLLHTVSLFIGLAVSMQAQDRPAGGTTLLPFQQSAVVAGNEEEIAMQYYLARDFVKAAEIYGRLYEKQPSGYLYNYLLFCLVESKEYSRATKLVKKHQQFDPGSLRYLVDLGYIEYRSGNPEKSAKAYDEAIRKLTANQQQIFDLANAFVMRGENDYAVKTYLRGRQLVTTYPFGFELASIYERMGDFTKAMEEYLDLLEVNQSYLNTIEDRIQSILSIDIDNEKSDAFRRMLLSRVQRDPEKSYYAEMLWWYSIQQQDFGLALIQGKALDRRLKENGDRLIQLAGLAISNGHYEVALEAYQYLVAKGPQSPFYDYCRREMVNTRYKMVLSSPSPQKKELDALQKEFHDELKEHGENQLSVPVMKNLAHLEGFYLGRPDTAISLLNRAIALGAPTPLATAECKLELADILLFTDDVWQATLLYQQVYKDYKNDVLGQEAKFRNTKLSFYIGEFNWAKAQADILKGATSKLIANDALALSLLISENLDPDSGTVALTLYSKAELLDFRNAEREALMTLDSIPALFSEHPILERVLYMKAQIYRKTGQYKLADSLYGAVMQEYPEGIMADEAIMQRAALAEKQGNDPARAMEYYQTLMKNYPGSIYVPDARKRYRLLRGDTVK